MEIKKFQWIGIAVGVVVIGVSFLFSGTNLFFFLLGIGVLVGVSPIMISLINEAKIANEKEEMFLEFARNLVESVKTGTPISKSIMNVKNKSYGALGVHVEKLSNQISVGIPFNIALKTFANDVRNPAISRALTLIGQAERAGGDIGEILESVANAVNMSNKLKKERKATISTLVVQGYIIFFVFMLIILVMQFRILPMVSGISGVESTGDSLGFGGGGGEPIDEKDVANSFLYLLMIQGFFSGLVIGKLAEGSSKAGLKHSFSLMVVSFLVTTGANLIFGG